MCCCVLVPVAANAANLLCPRSVSLSGCGARGRRAAASRRVLCCTLQGGTWVRRYVQPDRPTTDPRARPTEANPASQSIPGLPGLPGCREEGAELQFAA